MSYIHNDLWIYTHELIGIYTLANGYIPIDSHLYTY